MIRSYSRGWVIVYEGDKWLYEDTHQLYDDSRPCKKCNRFPYKGQDACLGTLKGIASACCGHGVSEVIRL